MEIWMIFLMVGFAIIAYVFSAVTLFVVVWLRALNKLKKKNSAEWKDPPIGKNFGKYDVRGNLIISIIVLGFTIGVTWIGTLVQFQQEFLLHHDSLFAPLFGISILTLIALLVGLSLDLRSLKKIKKFNLSYPFTRKELENAIDEWTSSRRVRMRYGSYAFSVEDKGWKEKYYSWMTIPLISPPKKS